MRERTRRTRVLLVSGFLAGLLGACGSAETSAGAGAVENIEGEGASAAEVVTPPFEVRGEAEGLLLVWFDAEGPHTASKRSDVPEASREHVRVDSLALGPGQRLDPGLVYVADLRSAGADGRYPVRRMARDAFEGMIERAAPSAPPPVSAVAEGAGAAAGASSDVVLYGASWCGACRSAASFFRSRGVAFVEKDIERDPGAAAELQQKVARAGVRTNGIPVIDFRGTIVPGFDQRRLETLIARGS